jgi:sec-independent protein translocase protein TatB
MFGIGPSEIILVAIILIIFIRPEDLPKFLRSAGKLYGQIKKTYDEVIMVKDKILKEIEDTAKLAESAMDITAIEEPKKAPEIAAPAAEAKPAAEPAAAPTVIHAVPSAAEEPPKSDS